MLLVGDAAHPMLQYLAQGACQALEDAAALEDAIRTTVFQSGKGDPTRWGEAIRQVNEIRAPHTARVQSTARAWGESWHVDGIGRTLRNLLFSARQPDDFHYTDWLYGESRA
jgi:salicylate hydroxylase